jgi:hypothetical protein
MCENQAEGPSLSAIFQETVLIEQELKKGDANHPTVTARADLLRKDIWDRWRAGEGLPTLAAPLKDAIRKLAEVADRQQLALLQQATTIHQPAPNSVDRPVVPARRNPQATLPEEGDANAGPSPLFSRDQDEYLAIHQNGGASAGASSTGRWHKRVQEWS